MSENNEKTPLIIRSSKPDKPLTPNYKNGFQRKLIINHDLRPINPYQCGKQKCPSGYSFGPAIRDFWLLHFVISGKGKLEKGNGLREVCENELFVIRPYEAAYYEADANDPWQYIWIGFTSDIDLPCILETSDVIPAPYLRNFFISACDEHFENNDTNGAYEHYLCGTVWQILGMLLLNSPKNTTLTDSYIRPAIKIISTNYQYNITVSDIASRLHISKGYFSDIFKAATGVSPKKYLNDLRMKKATELLTQKGFNITVTASSVGFPDVFVFSRAFKNHFGCSPTEYIKTHKKK